jgi:CBS domain-containing protein
MGEVVFVLLLHTARLVFMMFSPRCRVVPSDCSDLLCEQMNSAYPRAVPIVQKLYHGFVDVADVAALALRAGFKATKKGFLGKLAALMESDEAHAVVSAVNLSGRNLFYTLTTIDNLTKAATKMARDGIHRVAILDPERTTVLGVLTQSHVVRLLYENLSVLGEIAGLPVDRLFENGPRVVRCVPATATVRECLDIMLQRNISSVPIVSDTGALVSVFSFSDLRVVAGKPITDANAALEKPVMWLISPHEGDKVTSIPRRPVVVMAVDCLATVMELLVTTHVHRVYIVDHHMRPLGVISLTDVLRVLTAPIVVTRLRAASLEESMMEAFCDVDSEEKHFVSPLKATDGGESSLATLLRSTTADEFVHNDGVRIDKLVDVSNKESLKHVLQLMRTHALCVLPVYREVPAVSEAPMGSGSMPPSLLMVTGLVKPVEKHYIGWIDAGTVLDSLLWVLCVFVGV